MKLINKIIASLVIACLTISVYAQQDPNLKEKQKKNPYLLMLRLHS